MAKRKQIETAKTKWTHGQATFNLPTRVTKAMAELAARVYRAGSIGWAVAACGMRSEGVTIAETAVLSAMYGGKGKTRANVVRYNMLEPFTTVAYTTGATGRSVKTFCVDMVALRTHLDKQDKKIAKQLERPKSELYLFLFDYVIFEIEFKPRLSFLSRSRSNSTSFYFRII